MTEALTKNELGSLIDYIEVYFIENIRADTDFDNIDYLIDVASGLAKLRKAYKELADKEGVNDSQTKS